MKRFPALLFISLSLILIVISCGTRARSTVPTPTIISLPGATPTARILPTPSPLSGIPIPFRTLAQGFRLAATLPEPMPKPTLLAALNPTSLDAIAPFIDREHQDLLRTVNLENEVVLVAFWGVKPSGGFLITINTLSITDNELIVSVELRENDPTLPKIDAATLPYHIITISRSTWPKERILRYCLVSDAAILAVGTLP